MKPITPTQVRKKAQSLIVKLNKIYSEMYSLACEAEDSSGEHFELDRMNKADSLAHRADVLFNSSAMIREEIEDLKNEFN